MDRISYPALTFLLLISPSICSSFTLVKNKVVLSVTLYDIYVYSKVPLFGKEFAFNLFRPRVNLDITPVDSLKLVMSGDFEFYIGDKDSIALLNYTLQKEENSWLRAEGLRYRTNRLMTFSRLYRGYIRFTKAFLTLRAGRQRIDWGKGFFFTPLNPFTPKLNLSIEPEQVLGIDALLISVDVSNFFSLEGVYAPSADGHKFGLQFSGFIKGTDFSCIMIRKGEINEGGISAAFNLFDGILRTEVRVPRKRFDFLVGYDRSFKDLINVIFEYYYHGSDKPKVPSLTPEDIKLLRTKQVDDILSQLQNSDLFVYPGKGEIGTHYIALMFHKDFSYPLSLSLMFEMNLSDLSFVSFLKGMWSPYSQLEIEFGGAIPYGKINDEFWFMEKSLFVLLRIYL